MKKVRTTLNYILLFSCCLIFAFSAGLTITKAAEGDSTDDSIDTSSFGIITDIDQEMIVINDQAYQHTAETRYYTLSGASSNIFSFEEGDTVVFSFEANPCILLEMRKSDLPAHETAETPDTNEPEQPQSEGSDIKIEDGVWTN